MKSQNIKFAIYVFLFLCIVASLPIMTIYYSNSNDELLSYIESDDAYSCLELLNNENTYSIDLNGDDIKDTIYSDVSNDKYHLYCEINGTKHELEPQRPLNSIGTNSMKFLVLNFNDVTRTNIPDIIIHSLDNKTPMTHIFTYENNSFKDIFSSTDNCFGVLNNTNNKTPTIISLNILGDDIDIKEFMYINKKITNVSYEQTQIEGIPQIQSLIGTIQLPYEIDEGPDIFTEEADDFTKSLLWRLSKNTNSYEFNCCSFEDSKADKNGNPTEYTWNLYFSKFTKDGSKLIKPITFVVKLTKVGDQFLINSISEET